MFQFVLLLIVSHSLTLCALRMPPTDTPTLIRLKLASEYGYGNSPGTISTILTDKVNLLGSGAVRRAVLEMARGKLSHTCWAGEIIQVCFGVMFSVSKSFLISC
jgi:hypothetical protein